MPSIFDNIELHLLPTLKQAIQSAYRADFCVGYFNLRGWKELALLVDSWPGGDGNCARVLVGMQRPPQDELRTLYRLSGDQEEIDNQTAIRLKRKLAEEFKTQLTIGIPTNADEQALHCLAAQLRAGKVVVKLFLRHPLHAKLYLLHRNDPFAPILGYLGSSNLTLAGLSGPRLPEVIPLRAARAFLLTLLKHIKRDPALAAHDLPHTHPSSRAITRMYVQGISYNEYRINSITLKLNC
jgi:hypothetical protein